jgi:hypothetical protein
MFKLYKTRYEGLKYGHIKGPCGFWTYFDCHDPRMAPAQVGIQYATRDDLLADLNRYARQWGHITPDTFNVNSASNRLRVMDDCHTEGWACVLMGPDELEGATVRTIESIMLQAAWDYIISQRNV